MSRLNFWINGEHLNRLASELNPPEKTTAPGVTESATPPAPGDEPVPAEVWPSAPEAPTSSAAPIHITEPSFTPGETFSLAEAVRKHSSPPTALPTEESPRVQAETPAPEPIAAPPPAGRSVRERLSSFGGWLLRSEFLIGYSLMDQEGGVLIRENFSDAHLPVVADFTRGWRRLLSTSTPTSGQVSMACQEGFLTVLHCPSNYGFFILSGISERPLSQALCDRISAEVRNLAES